MIKDSKSAYSVLSISSIENILLGIPVGDVFIKILLSTDRVLRIFSVFLFLEGEIHHLFAVLDEIFVYDKEK